ncbi:MAG TPA: hypothetical protein VGS20_14325 [Candidatus Acidoferrales bacterium]|nr:hypothetical protein [Candidatus Acidoferrales bacterium]
MILYLRLGLVTCAFYLAGLLLLEATTLVVARWRGHFGIDATRAGWTLLHGIIWLLAFQLAWRVVVVRFLASRRP